METDYRILVFPKIASNTELSTVQMPTSASGIIGDTYAQSNCRSVEFYGQPSVYCEGEQTTVVYTPTPQQRPLENLDGNIMLAAVAMKLTSNLFGWIKENIMGESAENPIKQSMVSAEYFQAQKDKFLQQLDHIEDKIKACQNENTKIDLYWAEFALGNYRDEIKDFVTRGHATKEELEELRDDIAYFESKLNEETQISDTVVHTPSVTPVVSHYPQSFFYENRTTASYCVRHVLPITAGNSTANASDGSQGLNYVPKFTR